MERVDTSTNNALSLSPSVLSDNTINNNLDITSQLHYYNNLLLQYNIIQQPLTIPFSSSSSTHASTEADSNIYHSQQPWLTCISTLLTHIQEKQQQLTHSTDRITSLESTLHLNEQRITELRHTVDDTERKAWELELKRRNSEKTFTDEIKKINTQYNELQKKFVLLQRKDNQYKHEIRKLENDYRSVVEKYTKLMTSSSSSRNTSSKGSKNTDDHTHIFEIREASKVTQNENEKPKRNQNSIGAVTGTSTLRSTGASRIPLKNHSTSSSITISTEQYEYQQHIQQQQETRIHEVIEENTTLRHTLEGLEKQLSDVIVMYEQTITHAKNPTSQKSLLSPTKANNPPTHAGGILQSPRVIDALSDYNPVAQIHNGLPYSIEYHTKEYVEDAFLTRIQVLQERLLEYRKADMNEDEDDNDIEQAREKSNSELLELCEKLRQKIQLQHELMNEQERIIQRQLQQSTTHNDTTHHQVDIRSPDTSVNHYTSVSKQKVDGGDLSATAVVELEQQRLSLFEQQRMLDDYKQQMIEKLRVLELMNTPTGDDGKDNVGGGNVSSSHEVQKIIQELLDVLTVHPPTAKGDDQHMVSPLTQKKQLYGIVFSPDSLSSLLTPIPGNNHQQNSHASVNNIPSLSLPDPAVIPPSTSSSSIHHHRDNYAHPTATTTDDHYSDHVSDKHNSTKDIPSSTPTVPYPISNHNQTMMTKNNNHTNDGGYEEEY